MAIINSTSNSHSVEQSISIGSNYTKGFLKNLDNKHAIQWAWTAGQVANGGNILPPGEIIAINPPAKNAILYFYAYIINHPLQIEVY